MNGYKLPVINDGFFEGQAETPYDEAVQKCKVAERSPHEKGEFRLAYWRGRIHAVWTFGLSGCPKYMKIEHLEKLHSRLEAVYRETLVDMYGEKGAEEFLERTRKPLK